MKIKKLLLTFTTMPILLPIVVVSYKSNDNNETKIHINKNSTIEISKKDYKTIMNFYKPYYERLGLKYEINNTNYDNNGDYNNVGIIEVNGLKDYNSFLSQNDNFKFNVLNNDEETGRYGYAVTSIIGTDTGINKNANIYYYVDNRIRLLPTVKKCMISEI
ncbi:hypothetical protein NW063_01945 [Mycoplasmopsis cynos]|uniref:hypothetical protein n=1 Tax=Mycoplasmopsis cynos TaxID=171284 RepID=UPI0021FF97E9|nr:hypothetical protein [Mycoplasmopsis cynos]UWV86475.1 hypothetical protein NW063_01945 [Mycoplasmopsis cynos]